MVSALLVLVILSGWAFGGQDAAELEVEHALTFDFQTPHTKWARPYALGKIKVLFFVNGRGTEPRECVELMQRFDIAGQAVFWARSVDSNKDHWEGDVLGEQRIDKLLAQKWDAFIFLGIPISNLSSERREKVSKAVAEGAGVVLVGINDPDLLNEETRLQQTLPFLAPGPVGDGYTIGKGRGIRLPARPALGYYEGWEVDYDYWQERLGRAVLWSAGKEPVSRLQLNLTADGNAHDVPGKLTVTLMGTVLGEKPMLHLTFRRPGDAPVLLPVGEISVDHPLVFEIPKLSEGSYHADARVLSSLGVETWKTIPFEVHHQRRIAAIKLDKDWGEPGGVIQGNVTLTGKPLSKEVLRVQLLDRNRRVLGSKDLDLAAGPDAAQFKFEIADWLPMLTTVEARIISAGDEVSSAYRYFHVTRRRQGRFNFLIWDVPRGSLAPYAEESLAKHGVTLQLGQGNPPLYASAFNIAWVPYTTDILTAKTPEGIMKPFCWNDKDAAEKYIHDLANKYMGSREHGTFVYSLGDEIKTSGSCLSPHCADAYRNYLKNEYGSLEALNREWGTTYHDWAGVGLSQEGDNEEENSLKKKEYPRWFDRQAFKSWNFVQYAGKYKKAYKEIDPLAKTGFEGAGKFTGGGDLDLIVRNLDFWSPYPGMVDEVIRSIAPRDFIRANWMGYTKDADSLLDKYWRMVLLGVDSVWWWRWEVIGPYHGWLAPDLRPYPAVKELLEDTQIMRDGLGDLLLHSKMLDDGIAILYSYPSTFAGKLEEGATYETYEQANAATSKFLRSRGLQYRYVTDRMLRLGEFDASRYKLLFLPRTEALGDKEAEVIRKFVENGGTVVAGIRPGIYDDHCKLRQQGVLDDLFGITSISRAPAQTVTSQGATNFRYKIDPGIRICNGIQVQKSGEVPVIVTRKVGKGLAVLLNCDISALTQLSRTPPSKEDKVSPIDSVLREVFAHNPPQVTLEDQKGQHPEGIQIVRWQNGADEIIAFIREKGIKEDIKISLPEAKNIYDVRNRKVLGYSKNFSATITPDRASFFCVSGKPLAAPTLALDMNTASPGTIVTASLSVPESRNLRAFRIRVQDGDSNIDWLNQIVLVGKSSEKFKIPIAFNMGGKDYEISVLDAITGRSIVDKIAVLK